MNIMNDDNEYSESSIFSTGISPRHKSFKYVGSITLTNEFADEPLLLIISPSESLIPLEEIAQFSIVIEPDDDEKIGLESKFEKIAQ